MELETQALDITELARLQAELEGEIAVTAANLQLKEAEIAGAVGNDTFNLGIVLKLKTERLELASYLKGLQFGASKTGKS